MGGERRLGIRAALAEHVERVAGEDDHRRPAAPFDRERDGAGHLPRHVGSAGYETQAAEHQYLSTTRDRQRGFVDDARPTGCEVDEPGPGSGTHLLVFGPIPHRHRPTSFGASGRLWGPRHPAEQSR